jgi:hypothetical protein
MSVLDSIQVRHRYEHWCAEHDSVQPSVRLHALIRQVGPNLGGRSEAPPSVGRPPVIFGDRACLIGKNGPQTLVWVESWQDGEEEFVLTHAREDEFDYIWLYRFEYDRTAMASHQEFGVLDLEQADWLTRSVQAHLGAAARLHVNESVLDLDARRRPVARPRKN